MTRDDIPQVLDIAMDQFPKDELFTWLYPRHREFPNDLRFYTLHRIRSRFVERGVVSKVMVTDGEDPEWDGKSRVIGYAFYVRSGDDENGRKWQQDSIFQGEDWPPRRAAVEP
jgi:hypothetical protein